MKRPTLIYVGIVQMRVYLGETVERRLQKPVRLLPVPLRDGRCGRPTPKPVCARGSGDAAVIVGGAGCGETDKSCDDAPRAAALFNAAMDGVWRKVGSPGLVEVLLG